MDEREVAKRDAIERVQTKRKSLKRRRSQRKRVAERYASLRKNQNLRRLVLCLNGDLRWMSIINGGKKRKAGFLTVPETLKRRQKNVRRADASSSVKSLCLPSVKSISTFLISVTVDRNGGGHAVTSGPRSHASPSFSIFFSASCLPDISPALLLFFFFIGGSAFVADFFFISWSSCFIKVSAFDRSLSSKSLENSFDFWKRSILLPLSPVS